MFIIMYVVMCLGVAGIITYIAIKYGNKDKEDK